MIKVNIKKSNISDKKLLKMESEIVRIHSMITERTGKGSEMLDWLNWPQNYYKNEFDNIIKKVKELKTKLKVKKLLVIGIGGSYLGAKSGIDFVKGSIESLDEVMFVGTNMSSDYYNQIEKWLKNSKWAICVISKSGTTLEPSLAFRHFKKLLIKKVTKSKHNKYVVAITDAENGVLKKISIKEKYTTFTIPDGIGGRFSGITPVGLFPMCFAGIDIKKFMNGAKKAMKDFSKPSLSNPAYKYAAARTFLNRYGKKRFLKSKPYKMEVFSTYDPDLNFLGEFWKQLYGESEGKDGKGIFPTSVTYSADLHSLGQYIQEGERNLMFETTLWVKKSKSKTLVLKDNLDLDELNYLSGENLDNINKKASRAVMEAHHQGGNPQILIEINDKSEETLGYLWYFFFISVSMSGYLLNVNPFDQPGVELYKKLMFKKLKK